MEKFTNIIEKFVNKMGYLGNKSLEGIVWYGSSQTGFANNCSDIDLHIVFSELENEIRGSDFIDNHRLNILKKNYQACIVRQIMNFFINQMLWYLCLHTELY